MVYALLIFLAAAAPDITAGPDLVQEAKQVQAPIEHVTVYSDRARVRREAKLDLSAGIHVLRLPDIPGAVLMNTIRADCQGAKVIRISSAPVERKRYSIDQVDQLIARFEELGDRAAALDSENQVLQIELSILKGISVSPPVDESKRVDKPMPVLVSLGKRVLDFIQSRRQVLQKKSRVQRVLRKELEKEIFQVQAEIRRHDLGGFSMKLIQVLVILEAQQPRRATLQLEYFIRGAYWLPTYNIHFQLDKGQRGQASIKTAGLVVQSSGEDWSQVELDLSTSVPGMGIEMPKLLTWTLGEKREFIPRPYPARRPSTATAFRPPKPQKTIAEEEREAEQKALGNRLALLRTLSKIDPSREDLARHISSDKSVSRAPMEQKSMASISSRRPSSKSRPKRSKKEYAPPPMPSRGAPSMAPAMPSAKEERAEEIVISGSMVQGDSAAAQVSLGLFESGGYTKPTFSNPKLPAVAAKGLEFVYSSSTRVSVPSSDKQRRIPLFVQTCPVETFYEATPSLKKTAYLKASVVNQSKRPILRGSVNIFVGKDFIGQGQLDTTGRGGLIQMPLGADQDLRFVYNVVPKTVTEGVFSKDDVTEYTVKIEVGNYKKHAVRVAIFDQIPKTRNQDIKIQMGKVSPKQKEGPDSDGILRWELAIPAGKVKKMKFSYKLTRPVNWQLRQ